MQTTHKRQFTLHKWIQHILVPLFLSNFSSTVHAIPGINHVLISGEQLFGTHWQTTYVNTIISSLNKKHTQELPTALPSENHPSNATSTTSYLKNSLRQEPYYFIVDTGSVQCAIDTAVNRIIVKDDQYITNIVTNSDNIKIIGGKSVRISGTGKLYVSLKSDDKNTSIVSDLDAVYVPSSLYNLTPPQILIWKMRKQGYQIDYFLHDDSNYIFKYSKSDTKSTHTITIPINRNSLFHLRKNEEFTSFMSHVPHYLV